MMTSTDGRSRDAVRSQLMRAVDEAENTLLAHADEAEALGTLPEVSWRALQDAGLFLFKAPRDVGGLEADPVTQIELIERVASIDTSAAWAMMIGATSVAMLTASIPEAGLTDVRVEGRLPRVAGGITPSATATRTSGGYKVSGRWQFGSGSAHAEWLLGPGFIEGDEPRRPRTFAFPRSDVRIHEDTWNVRALRGTGSYDIAVSNAFVPEHLTYDGSKPPARGGVLYKIRVPGFVALEHGAFALGAAGRALSEVAELAKSKTRGYINPVGVAGRGSFQNELGRCDLALRAARGELRQANAAAWALVNDGGECDAGMQTELRCAAVYATDVAIDVARRMFRHAGAKSLYAGNVVERCLRDVTAAGQHAMVSDAAYEKRGQILLGFPNVAAMD
jgi:alkylation response protein AidB-like acyl-CoA dehydrogenase